MFRNSITLKVFGLIALGFGIVFLAAVISPLFLFEDFYFTRRLEDAKNATLQFADEQFSSSIDEIALNEAMYDFKEANNALVDIINLNSLDQSYNFDYTFTIDNAKYGTVELYFNKLTTYSTEFYKVFEEIGPGDPIYLTGYFIDNNVFCPTKINDYYIDKDIYEINNLYFLSIYEVDLLGKVSAISPPVTESGSLYKSKLLWEQYDTYRKDGFELVEDEVKVYEYIDNETGLMNFGLVTLKNDFLIAVIITEQSKTEYVQYMSQYLQYIIFGSLLIILSLTIILTRLIAKPLVDINSTAEKMAALDFSEKIPVNSKDEIGRLSESLNTLSEALESTLSELNSAYNLVQTELKNEKQLELMRKDFVADASHELKTPLGIVRGYTERIQDKILESDFNQDYLISCTGIILDEMRKMDRLILNMNELSKLESINYDVDPKPLDITWTVQAITDAFLILSEEKNLQIHASFEEIPQPIIADKHRMEQVFSNLISNAIRYTKENGHIYLSLKQSENKVIFNIENEFDQLDALNLDKIWDRFYRMDKSRSRALGGSGLGLSIVKIILEKHKFSYKAYKTNRCVGFEIEMK